MNQKQSRISKTSLKKQLKKTKIYSMDKRKKSEYKAKNKFGIYVTLRGRANTDCRFITEY